MNHYIVYIYWAILILRGQTALHKAAWYGYREICKILVEAGASLFITDYQVSNNVIIVTFYYLCQDNTPYHKSIQSEDVDLQEYLKSKYFKLFIILILLTTWYHCLVKE